MLKKRNMGSAAIRYGNGQYEPFEESRIISEIWVREAAKMRSYGKYIRKWHTMDRHKGNKLAVNIVTNGARNMISSMGLESKQVILDGEKDFIARGNFIGQQVRRDAWKSFVLPECSSGTKKYRGAGVARRVEQGVLPVGAWTTYCEEADLFGNFETISDVIRTYGEVGGMIIDAFYRDSMFYGAGFRYDLTQKENGYNSVTSPALDMFLRFVVSRMKYFGARPVSSITTQSPNYGTEPTMTSFVMKVPDIAAINLRLNPGFVPVEKYTTNPIMDEIGRIGELRIVTDNDQPLREQEGRIVIDAMIIAESPIDGLRVRGIGSGLNMIHIPINKQEKSDPLSRYGVVGFKSWLGAIVTNPERVAVISMYLDMMNGDEMIEYAKKCGDYCLPDCTSDAQYLSTSETC
jgi:N4-gp56 family major capsid protein